MGRVGGLCLIISVLLGKLSLAASTNTSMSLVNTSVYAAVLCPLRKCCSPEVRSPAVLQQQRTEKSCGQQAC